VLLVGRISKLGTSKPGPVARRVLVAKRAWASGWASATRWANFQVRNFQTQANG